MSGFEDLLQDLEIAPQAFHLGESSVIDCFALATGIDPGQARARSFRSAMNGASEIAGQRIADRSLFRRQFRVCPACLREDIGTELTKDTAFRPYARIAWSLTSVHCYPVHRLLLVLPPEPKLTYDFAQCWEPWLLELFDGERDEPTTSAGKYETFAIDILSGREPLKPGFLADHALETFGTAAEVLGLLSLYGAKWSRTAMSAGDVAVATDVGFKVLAGGHQTVQSFLVRLRFATGQPQERPPGRYGKLHEWLLRGGGSGEDFTFLQDHLSRHIQDTWRLGPGDVCFRTKADGSRFLSVLTAAAQYGLRTGQVHDLLQGAGLSGALPLPDYEQIYEADAVELVLDQVSSSISMAAAMQALGLTRTQMATLIEAGFLTVSRGGANPDPGFREGISIPSCPDIARFRSGVICRLNQTKLASMLPHDVTLFRHLRSAVSFSKES